MIIKNINFKIKKTEHIVQKVFRYYPQGSVNQTFSNEAFELYKSFIIKKKDSINAIHAYLNYYYKDQLNYLFSYV